MNMNQIQSDGMIDVAVGLMDISHHHYTNAVHVATGALGRGLNGNRVCSQTSEEEKAVTQRHISIVQAENALQRLFSASQGGGEGKPSLRDVLQMDPIMLSMMMAQLILSVSTSNAQALYWQIERATEVQNVLRDKKVKEYQEQIQNAVEQADEVRKAGIVNVLFDWVIDGVELGIGIMKVAEGVLTADLWDVVDGVAYFEAGVLGCVKAGAETALALGADKDDCQSIVNVFGYAQLGCEGIAMSLDLIQIGRAICASRAVTSAAEKVLDSGLGEKILDGIVKGAEEGIEVLAGEVGEAVGKKLVQDFGMAVEREMVEVGDMASEAASHSAEAETNMVESMGKRFTRAGVESMMKKAVLEAGSKALLEEGVELTEEALRDTITSKLLTKIAKIVVDDINVNEILQFVRDAACTLNRITSAMVDLSVAEIRKRIEQLIVQQSFIDFMEDWTEDRKETQQKRLQDTCQQSSEAIKSTLQIIDSYGSVLAGIAYGRA